MPSIKVYGHSIYYETSGQGDPLILIAGLGTSCLMWWKQIEPLSKKYHVIAFDHRGIGKSSRASKAFTIADLAADVAALIRALDLPPCHVLGVSMGGFVALSMGIVFPELINKLILISTSAGGPTHVPSGKAILDIILGGNQSDVEGYCRNLYPALAGPGYMHAHPEDLDHAVANALAKPLSPETYLYQLNAIGQYTSVHGNDMALARVKAPVLIIHGDADALVPLPNGQYLADHIQGAKMLIYPGCGHLIPMEAADRLNQDVTAFLK
jgi:pimeloyl-ACP methyl ester carboxylesterase